MQFMIRLAGGLNAVIGSHTSLSPEEQPQIKTQAALRLFGARNGKTNANEGIPINTNDLLLKLLDKVEFAKKPDSEKKISGNKL